MTKIVCESCGYDLSTLPGCAEADFTCPECGGVGTGRPEQTQRYADDALGWIGGSLAIGGVFALGALLFTIAADAFGHSTYAAANCAMGLAWVTFSIGIWRAHVKPASVRAAVVYALASLIAGGVVAAIVFLALGLIALLTIGI